MGSGPSRGEAWSDDSAPEEDRDDDHDPPPPRRASRRQGTGHNATAIASLEDTVPLKTSQMRGVSIDAPNRRARVDAGVLWMKATGPAHEHGLLALGSSSPDVGVVGYSLGGGLSWLGRKYGLAVNHVLAAEVVTADGELHRVDADHDPDDLFCSNHPIPPAH